MLLMDKNTIHLLNELNKQFYQIVEQSFDRTRQAPWDGWYRIVEVIEQELPKNKSLKVLDIGCGNGRFGLFLKQKLNTPFEYIGIDSNQFLLQQAKKHSRLRDATFIRQDVLNFDFEKLPHVDIIVLFGVIHHIPSFNLRQDLLLQLVKVLEPNGLLLISAWQFPKMKNFDIKLISPESVPNLNRQQLEQNDYFLGWDKQTTAIRYCHHVDETELQQLMRPTNLKQLASWEDDGTNFYAAFQKQHTNLSSEASAKSDH